MIILVTTIVATEQVIEVKRELEGEENLEEDFKT